MSSLFLWAKKIIDSYYAVPLIALLVGLTFSEELIGIAAYGTWLISVIFFLSALKIDTKKVLRQFDDKMMLAAEVLMMLIAYPLIIYLFSHMIGDELFLPLLILAAMPAGMTSPFLAELVGGRPSLALVVTILTSLLAPLTIPFVLIIFAGAYVKVSYMTMMISLAKVIFAPYILARLVKNFAPKVVASTQSTYRTISVLLLGMLITGVVAKQAHPIIEGFATGSTLQTLLVLIGCFVGFHVLGYFLPFWRDHRDRITSTVCLSYMNFTLALYLADNFFRDERVIVPIVLAVIPWAVLFVPFRYIASRIM